MDLYNKLMEMVITEDSTEEYIERRSLLEFKFLEKFAKKIAKKSVSNLNRDRINKIKGINKIEDAKYEIKQVTSKDMFKKLYLGEALCKEGININESKEAPQKIANMLVNN